MGRRRGSSTNEEPSRRRPAGTPDGRESQLISLAVDLAEKQMRDGTASSQVISHYLKLGSSRERLEQERLARENELLEEKKKNLASASRVEELMVSAINAFRSYSGQPPVEHDEHDDYNDEYED